MISLKLGINPGIYWNITFPSTQKEFLLNCPGNLQSFNNKISTGYHSINTEARYADSWFVGYLSSQFHRKSKLILQHCSVEFWWLVFSLKKGLHPLRQKVWHFQELMVQACNIKVDLRKWLLASFSLFLMLFFFFKE